MARRRQLRLTTKTQNPLTAVWSKRPAGTVPPWLRCRKEAAVTEPGAGVSSLLPGTKAQTLLWKSHSELCVGSKQMSGK